jgi:hypothetical protein
MKSVNIAQTMPTISKILTEFVFAARFSINTIAPSIKELIATIVEKNGVNNDTTPNIIAKIAFLLCFIHNTSPKL